MILRNCGSQRTTASLAAIKLPRQPGHTGFQQWDKFASQTSAAIDLTAGERYFIEVLYRENRLQDNASIGVSTGGAAMAPIPAANLLSYGNDPDNFDDDDLPDSWEMAYELDPTDNGRIDPVNGANGDVDGDGISNLIECLAGTDPGTVGGVVNFIRILRHPVE